MMLGCADFLSFLLNLLSLLDEVIIVVNSFPCFVKFLALSV